MLRRDVGERFVKAIRLCNYAEWYNKGQNQCVSCSNESGASYPLTINAESCTQCSSVIDGDITEANVDADSLNRLSYLSRHSETYGRTISAQSEESFFDIGDEVPDSFYQ